MGGRRGDWPTPEEKLAALHDKLIAAVEELTSSQAWMRMLQVAARFPDYSPSNVLLIAVQRPDATRVAGLRTWNSLGRRVLKGEHGIAILAPCLYKQPGVEESTVAPKSTVDQPAGNSADAAAGADSATTRRELRGFRVVHVFDISQTDGDPLPDVVPERLTGPAPEHLWDRLAGLVEADGYRIERGQCGGANGYTSFSQHVVRIRDDVEPAQAVKTLAHELGHIRADHDHRFPDYATNHGCRGQAEVEAESIAYVVTAAAGLDVQGYSVPYVAGWSGGDSSAMRHTATLVLDASRRIGEAMQSADGGVDASVRTRRDSTAMRPVAQQVDRAHRSLLQLGE